MQAALVYNTNCKTMRQRIRIIFFKTISKILNFRPLQASLNVILAKEATVAKKSEILRV